MKKIMVRVLGCIIMAVCIISVAKFILFDNKYRVSINNSNSEVNDFDNDKQQNKSDNGSSNDEVWNKIRTECGGGIIADIDDTVIQDDWAYHVNSYRVTKEKGSWENPEWDKYEFDNTGNLINEFSFIVINITVECKKKSDAEFWLNCMTFLTFDTQGKNIGGSEMSTATIDKPMTKSFYRYNLELGDVLTTDIVFILDDNMISEENYYLLSINNTGISASHISPEDHSYIKIPIEEK